MIKIIYIFTNLTVGGAENVLLRLLSKIDKKKYDPLVISLIEKGKIGRDIRLTEIIIKQKKDIDTHLLKDKNIKLQKLK